MQHLHSEHEFSNNRISNGVASPHGEILGTTKTGSESYLFLKSAPVLEKDLGELLSQMCKRLSSLSILQRYLKAEDDKPVSCKGGRRARFVILKVSLIAEKGRHVP